MLYADAITAFTVVQLIAFIYLLSHGDCFTANVLNGVYGSVVLSLFVSGVNLFLVKRCQQGENCIYGASRDPIIVPLVNGAWRVRYALIVAAGMTNIAVLGLLSLAKASGRLFIDCSALAK